MFNFNSVVDQVAQASKTPLTYVEDKGIRANLETLVDAYADFTKTAYETGLELSKQAVEAAKNVDYSKFFTLAK
jgi:dihydropteroate synthase